MQNLIIIKEEDFRSTKEFEGKIKFYLNDDYEIHTINSVTVHEKYTHSVVFLTKELIKKEKKKVI